MNTYRVVFRINGIVHKQVIQANGVYQAKQLFLAQFPGADIIGIEQL